MARNTGDGGTSGNGGEFDGSDPASRRANERRDDDARRATGSQADGDDAPRDRYRDDDDQRDRLGADERMGTSPDTKSEAQGSARVNVGDTAHDQKDRDLKDRG